MVFAMFIYYYYVSFFVFSISAREQSQTAAGLLQLLSCWQANLGYEQNAFPSAQCATLAASLGGEQDISCEQTARGTQN